MGAFGRFLRVQPGEGRTVGLVVALTFVTFAGLTIGESGVNALFFDRIGTDSLPLMYLAQGATGLAAMLALTGWLARFDRRRAYVAIPLSIAAVALAERTILATGPGWIYPVLWLTVPIAVLLQAVFLWGTAGLVTDTRRAKRRPSRIRGGTALILYAPLLAVGSLVAVPTLGFFLSPTFCSCVDPPVLVGASLLVAGVATGWISIAAIRGHQPEPPLAARLLGWAGVCGAFAAGSFTTAREITAIL